MQRKLGYNKHHCKHEYAKFGSKLTEIPDDIPDVTTYVNLRRNDISTLPSSNFSNLYTCIFIDLRYNDISDIKKDAFKGLDSLNTLWLSSNRLKSLAPGMFDGLTNLENLYLRINSIDSIEFRTFVGLDELKILDISQNKLTKIEAGSLIGLSSLKELHISGNSLTTLDEGLFNEFPSPLIVAFSSSMDSDEKDNKFSCNSDLCWLEKKEESRNIIFYEYRGEVFKPRCADGIIWNPTKLNCTETGGFRCYLCNGQTKNRLQIIKLYSNFLSSHLVLRLHKLSDYFIAPETLSQL